MHMIDLNEEDSEGNTVFGKRDQIFAKLCFHKTLRWNSSYSVQAAKIGKSGLPARPIRGRTIILKTLCCPDDRATAVANGVGSKNDGNPISILVEDGYIQNRGFSVPKGEVNGIVRIRIEIIRFVVGGQQMVAQEVPDYILPQVSGNLLRAGIPKADSPVSVD